MTILTPTPEIITPASAKNLADLLADCSETSTPVAINSADLTGVNGGTLIDLSALNQVRDYEPKDLVITAETGMTIGELNKILAEYNQCFPLTYPDSTRLIDIIAEDRPSIEAGIKGYPRDYILGLEIATPDGKLTQCGGKVMKNVTGYDLMKLYTGNHNTLGIVTAATFKLITLPEKKVMLSYSIDSLKDYLDLALKLPYLNAFYNPCSSMTSVGIEVIPKKSNYSAQFNFSFQGFQKQVEQTANHLESAFNSSRFTRNQVNTPYTKDYFQTAPNKLSVELITGLGPWGFILNEFINMTDESLLPDSIFTLPKAGIIQLNWDKNNSITSENLSAILPDWEKLCQKTGGFVQLTSIPDGFETLAEEYNLPKDPMVRELHTRLKTTYDPKHILKSRRLPL